MKNSVLGRGFLDILAEACATEDATQDTIDVVGNHENEDEIDDDCCDDEEIEDAEDGYEEVEDDDEDDIHYTVEMVNVIARQKEGYNRYIVEAENLAKFMESNDIDDPYKALEAVCEANEISMGDTYVLMESVENFKRAILENKTLAAKDPVMSKAAKNKLGNYVRSFAKFKNSGVKLLKRRNPNVLGLDPDRRTALK